MSPRRISPFFALVAMLAGASVAHAGKPGHHRIGCQLVIENAAEITDRVVFGYPVDGAVHRFESAAAFEISGKELYLYAVPRDDALAAKILAGETVAPADLGSAAKSADWYGCSTSDEVPDADPMQHVEQRRRVGASAGGVLTIERVGEFRVDVYGERVVEAEVDAPPAPIPPPSSLRFLAVLGAVALSAVFGAIAGFYRGARRRRGRH